MSEYEIGMNVVSWLITILAVLGMIGMMAIKDVATRERDLSKSKLTKDDVERAKLMYFRITNASFAMKFKFIFILGWTLLKNIVRAILEGKEDSK